jgi:phenylalanine ammonia-lyase
MQLCGILPVQDKSSNKKVGIHDLALPNSNQETSLSMPEAWVRSAMLIRANSLVRGHSAVRLSVVESLLQLLRHNYVPLVPLRGSISASGDLSPLSYIAGLLEGNPDVRVWSGDKHNRTLIPADVALSQLELDPVVFRAKEGLGVLNGTAFSAGVASLALYESNHLAVFSQVLTAMGVEALNGESGSFDPFIAAVRPHSGQTEVAANITYFLKGSHFVRGGADHDHGRPLAQDRYALRTSSQWLGPQLEDLVLANSQLLTELNSTTDNPLIDAAGQKMHHGGNFQAASVTSSTEKTRLALQMMGKMIFAQSCELLDVRLNNGLPPNLAIDEPSLSYTLKGVDINMAAYMSELAFLANPVSSHVQSAEMGNQAINSLALISARYTHMSVDILSLMCSAYLYSLCQALDLRAMNFKFLQLLKPALEEITTSIFENAVSPVLLESLHSRLWTVISTSLLATQAKDSSERFAVIAKSAHTTLIEFLGEVSKPDETSADQFLDALSLIRSWTDQVVTTAQAIFINNRSAYLKSPNATEYLGAASKRMYIFVREELQVPLHRGLSDHPVTMDKSDSEQGKDLGHDKPKANTGSRISVIYQAMRNGRISVPIMECLEEALNERT